MFSILLGILDFFSILCGALASRSFVNGPSVVPTSVCTLLAFFSIATALLTFHWFGVYLRRATETPTRSAIRALSAWLISQLAIDVCSHLYLDTDLHDTWIVCWSGMTAAALVLVRYVAYAIRRSLRAHGHARTPVAVVSCGTESLPLVERFAQRTDSAFSLELLFDPTLTRDQLIAGVPAVRQLDSLVQLLHAQRIRELWIVDTVQRHPAINHTIDALRDDFINIRIVPALSGHTLPDPTIVDCLGLPVLNLIATPEQGLCKTMFDRFFACCALLALAPLLAVIAIAIKCSSPGPVFFRQSRKGANGEVFSIYKFRTMYQGADRPGTVTQASRNDARVTRIGRFLRSTSLDELPQFINVIKGDMSVVGPRPHAVEHDEYYKNLVEHYMYRYRIKPGITGWAQVNGYRGETERVEKMAARVMFDIHYIQHWTLWLDLKIVWLTVLKGFVGKNAY